MEASKVLAEAKRLHKLGMAVHWLRPRLKVPVEKGWTTGPRKGWKYLERTYQKGFNVGVRLGEASRMPDGFLAVVDVDVKSEDPKYRKEAVSAVRKILNGHGGTAPVVLSGRGNGSRHYYVLTEKPFKTFNAARSQTKVKVHMPSKEPSRYERETLSATELKAGLRIAHAWEISLYSEGRQVVLPPSIHPDSGERYRWTREFLSNPPLFTPSYAGISPDDTALTVRPAVPDEKGGPIPLAGLTGFAVAPVELSWLELSKDVYLGITEGKGVTDRSGFLMKASSALFSAGLSQNEVLTVLTDPKTFLGACGYEHAKTKNRARAAEWVYRYTVKGVVAEREAGGAVFAKGVTEARVLTEAEQDSQESELTEERNWRQDLDKTDKGKPRATLKNVDLFLTNMTDGHLFIQDLFTNRIFFGIDSPWGTKKKSFLEDDDLISLKHWFSWNAGFEPNTGLGHEATRLIARRHSVHPVRDYLNSLKWDGKPRIDTWIKKYCNGKAKEPYLSQVSRKFLLAMVKRIFEPGCQWDYVLVLEGPQGNRKSSIARALATDDWFMDNLPDLKDKDAMLNLQGKWLIELGELADVKRADYNHVKAYLIRRTDTVRPHYGRIQKDVPRQSVFIGTVNEGQYLRDPTGNRRYWPVKVGFCNLEKLKAVRDQLFAEAMHIYRETDEILMLENPVAESQAKEAQDDRRVDDEGTEMRDAFISFAQSEAAQSFNFEKFKVRDLMVGVSAPWGEWANKPGYILNVAAHTLMTLGFERFKSSGVRFWRKIEGHPRVIPQNDDPTENF